MAIISYRLTKSFVDAETGRKPSIAEVLLFPDLEAACAVEMLIKTVAEENNLIDLVDGYDSRDQTARREEEEMGPNLGDEEEGFGETLVDGGLGARIGAVAGECVGRHDEERPVFGGEYAQDEIARGLRSWSQRE